MNKNFQNVFSKSGGFGGNKIKAICMSSIDDEIYASSMDQELGKLYCQSMPTRSTYATRKRTSPNAG